MVAPERVLSVYVVWHPACPRGQELAESLFRELCADPDLPAVRGLGIPVRFRTSVLDPDGSAPVPAAIPFGQARHSAVFVLADDHLVTDPAWRTYADHLAGRVQPEDRVIPVALVDPATFPSVLGSRQAIRLAAAPADQQGAYLANEVLNDLCRLLEPGAGKVKVFLSHAKADGAVITGRLRRYLHEQTRLDDFFDAADIPDGSSFAEFLLEAAGHEPALLAVLTDSYASREWCQLEVLEAKAKNLPIVVLAALDIGEARSFPYLGNVPVVAWKPKTSPVSLVHLLLREVLRTRYFPKRVGQLCAQHGIDTTQVFARPPELLSVLAYRLASLAAGSVPGWYVYPDPPLGTVELRLLRQLDDRIEPVTPTSLAATR